MWEVVGEDGNEWYLFLSVGRSGKRGEGIDECGLDLLNYEKNRA